MPTLSAYSNTENTALVILTKRGFRVWLDETAQLYYAEQDGWDFAASSLMELLGTVAVFDYHNPSEFRDYWWKIDEPWLLDDVAENPPDYHPVWKRQDGQ